MRIPTFRRLCRCCLCGARDIDHPCRVFSAAVYVAFLEISMPAASMNVGWTWVEARRLCGFAQGRFCGPDDGLHWGVHVSLAAAVPSHFCGPAVVADLRMHTCHAAFAAVLSEAFWRSARRCEVRPLKPLLLRPRHRHWNAGEEALPCRLCWLRTSPCHTLYAASVSAAAV